MKRIIKRFKITLLMSIDIIPYVGAKTDSMIEFYWFCFRFNLYYPLRNKYKPKVEDIF